MSIARGARSAQSLRRGRCRGHGSGRRKSRGCGGRDDCDRGAVGAGKSTLLHLLAALDTPTSGTVYFQSKALETHRDEAVADFRNQQVGFVWQRHHLLPDFTAAENVAMPLLMRERRLCARRLKRPASGLSEVGLASRAASTGRGAIWRGATARGDCASAGQRAGGVAGGRAHRGFGRTERHWRSWI